MKENLQTKLSRLSKEELIEKLTSSTSPAVPTEQFTKNDVITQAPLHKLSPLEVEQLAERYQYSLALNNKFVKFVQAILPIIKELFDKFTPEGKLKSKVFFFIYRIDDIYKAVVRMIQVVKELQDDLTPISNGDDSGRKELRTGEL